jgi:bacterioferritin
MRGTSCVKPRGVAHRLTVLFEFRSCASFDLLAFLNRYRERLDGGQFFVRKRLPIEPFLDHGLKLLFRVAWRLLRFPECSVQQRIARHGDYAPVCIRQVTQRDEVPSFIDTVECSGMARAFQFAVDTVVEQLNRILQMELAAVICYTHYSFMIYGHARIPITSWLRDNATESLAHAQEAGQMIMRLHKRPALGIASLPTTRHNTIDEILAESIQREEAGVELYRELLAL